MLGMYDMHNHFLYGVDDGAKIMKDSLELIEKDYQEGVRHIMLTPHYRKGMFETSREKVEEHFALLQKLAAIQFPDLELLLGREFHANMDMIEMINEAPEHYCLGDSKMVLIEFSAAHSYPFIRERCNNLIVNGYVPLVAHVERYPELIKSLDNLAELQELGCYIQVNADSISGKSGFKTKRLCKKMLEEDLIDIIGTDGHNLITRIPGIEACYKQLIKVVGQEEADYLLCERPAELLAEHQR